MMAAGVTGIVAVVVMKLIDLQTSTSKRAFQDQTINQVLNEMNTYLATVVTCSEAMIANGEVNLNSEEPRELIIYSRPGNERYKAGSKIDAVEIQSIVARPNDATVYGEKSVFDIHVKFYRKGKNATVKLRKLKVIGSISVEGVVESCESYDNTAAVEMRRMICEDDLNGMINDQGNCVFDSGSKGNVVKESVCEMMGGNFNASTDRCEVISAEKHSFLGNANSSGNSDCAAAEKGAVRYNTNSQVEALEFCDGKKWGTFGNTSPVNNEFIVFPENKFRCDQLVDRVNQEAGNAIGSGFNQLNPNTFISIYGNWMLVVSSCPQSGTVQNATATIPRNGNGEAINGFYNYNKIN